MTDKIEIQGKTVNEAVSEALLRMGARRDEVNVKVLEEPKTGFLGFLGGRQARVLVERRAGGGRGGRDRRGRPDRDEAAGRRPANGQGQRSSRGGRPDGRGDRSERGERGERGERRPEARTEDRGRGRDGNRRPQGQEFSSAVRPDATPRAESRGESRDEGRGEGPDGRRGGRGRGARGGRGRGGRGGAVGRERDERRPAVAAPGDVAVTPAVMQAAAPLRDPQPAASAVAQAASVPPAPRAAADDASGGREAAAPPAATARPTAIDAMLAEGLQCAKYAQPLRGVQEEGVDQALTGLTSGMLVRAGFPCRCEVVPGEYRQVRVVTDDGGARILIGRHGATVDAVEHIVERMASAASGDRVKMNLDINNYRRRRADSLTGRVGEAIANVRSTGQEFHMEPMNARERRLVHLEVAEESGLRTLTIEDENGKHVVIAIDDGTAPAGATTDPGDDVLDEAVVGLPADGGAGPEADGAGLTPAGPQG